MRKISLRKCSIAKIDNETANDFLDVNHRQGAARIAASLVSIGITHEEELVGVIQFCYPRTEEKKRLYSAELLRLAFKKDVRIYRGASALIKYYIQEFNPTDFFTYQDTSGEATSVYEHAGMTFVSQAKRKQYLVAPGKSLETGSRKEVLGMAYATRYGPDRILGTKVGVVLRLDGSSKSNKEIFLENLGWHIEETAGDRVYEWVDQSRSYYTYKITASDSDKYYYGVKSIKVENATAEHCLSDGYMGSGGIKGTNKFKNWKQIHSGKLKKEVIGIYSRKAEAYLAEKELVGNAWATDKLCLNSAPGGKTHAPVADYRIRVVRAICPVHGEVTHRAGGSCFKCTNATELKNCTIHGETKFQAGACAKCKAVAPKTKTCAVHGSATHRGPVCLKCAQESSVLLLCELHGLPIFKKDKLNRCLGCIAQNVGVEKCEIHQEHHRWGSCQSCKKEKKASKLAAIENRKIAIELRRSAPKPIEPTFTVRECLIHGSSTFRKELCTKCQTLSAITKKECSVHGITKHQGEVCAKCSSQKSYIAKECPKHGVAKFSGDSCSKCRAEAGVKTVECPVHGTATSIGNRCRLCVNQKAVNLRECSIHGLTKHQGDKCSSCSSMATAHRIHHGSKPNKKCHLCQGFAIA